MALFHMNDDSLDEIPLGTFGDYGKRERDHIQRAVRANINAITPGVQTMVLAEEYSNWSGSARRIDLLCLDEKKNLVVVELKRDDSAFMDLQALRYAAMVSTMKFKDAVAAHANFLSETNSDADAEQAIRAFLNAEEDEIAFSDTVRIVLASASFSPELTTAVLWLNKQGNMDIRCVQLRPHKVDDKVLLDIEQLIPLPQAQQYTVDLREKTQEQERVRVASRSTPRYNLTIGDAFYSELPRKLLLLELVRDALRQGVTPEQIMDTFTWRKDRLFKSAPGLADESAFRARYPKDPLKFFFDDKDRFVVDGKTYVFASDWGVHTIRAAQNIKSLMPNQSDVVWQECIQDMHEVRHKEYLVRQRGKAIEVERDGVPVTSAVDALRDLAHRLGVKTTYNSNEPANTQNLGARVIAAIKSLPSETR
jgi:hypothetical protein